ncbi:MAG: Uncharacterized protein G01um101429_149 [Parcubacteria group bacterium Gr01-1014_29]|nr:MAG: Uncharacterized protein G01um101429_149 [Parcubacteria group bacterium Gr01-1014_29]
MHKLLILIRQHFRNPLLFLAVLAVVFVAAFSPIFSQNVDAQPPPTPSPNTTFACNTATGCSTNRFDTSTCDNQCLSDETCIPSNQCTSVTNPTKEALDAAASGVVTWAVEKVLEGIVEILKFINSMLVKLVGVFAQLLDAAIALSLAGLGGIEAITIGWTITRDIANIFFIFILLIIAIATILRLEQYGAKQLLPKLIIIALLINFSLVIAFAVVDASNVLALAFIGEISPVSDKIATVLQISKINTKTEPQAEHTEIDWQSVTSTGWPAGMGIINQPFTLDATIIANAPVQNVFSEQSTEFFWQATILILLLTLIFVFISLSVMLLIRSVALIIIFVLAPLGFLAAILPQTRGYSTQWWQKLFHWAFFFPASAFMIYLALQYGAQMTQIFGSGTGSHVINTGVLFNYFVVVALLIGSLIVARQMGIAGAAAAIGIGAGLARRARGYAGKMGRGAAYYGYRGVTALPRAGARAAGRGIGDWAGRKLEGTAGTIPILRGGLLRISEAREKALAEEMKRMGNLSAPALANFQGGLTGMSYEAGIRTFAKLRPEDQRRYADTMGKDKFNKFAEVVGQQLGEPGKKLAAKATGDVHEAMRILHRKQFGDMAHEPAEGEAGYDAYQQQAHDYLSGLTTKEIGMLSVNTVRTSDALREYIFRNSENMKEMLTKREHVQAFSENINDHLNKNITLMTLAGVSRNDQIANEIKAKGGPITLETAFRSGIGVNVVLNPSKVPIGTKRGIVTTVTAEGE